MFRACNQLGISSEKYFEEVLSSNGVHFKKSSKSEDINHHIDYWVLNENNGEWISIDVKSKKRLSRRSDEFSDDLLFVEFKNVSGSKGWLFGAATCIAFEINNGFLMVFRDELASLCKELCDIEIFEIQPTLYKGYRRSDRPNELVSLIKKVDIYQNISYQELTTNNMGNF